jgi:hypothetical protein
LVVASIDDLTIDNLIYVRGRRAIITSLDFPLVFWRFEGETVVLHRSFMSSREMFQVPVNKLLQPSNGSFAVSEANGDDWADFDMPGDNASIESSAFRSAKPVSSGNDGPAILASFSEPSSELMEALAEDDFADFEFAPAPSVASSANQVTSQLEDVAGVQKDSSSDSESESSKPIQAGPSSEINSNLMYVLVVILHLSFLYFFIVNLNVLICI